MRSFLLTVLYGCWVATSAKGLDLETLLDKHRLPALGATSVYDKGTKTWVVGQRKFGDPTFAMESDQFHLGSCTKAMTATLLALLIERGHLNWNSTLEELFPKLASEMNLSFRKVTVAELAAHRSGITEDLIKFADGRLWKELDNEKLDPMVGRELATRYLLTAPPAFPPRSRFEYSNGNYIILGAVLESLSGKSWEKLIREEIFVPLDMSSCGFGPQADPKSKKPDQPWPHLRNTENQLPLPIPPTYKSDNPRSVGPAGSVHCSLGDWAKFARLHLDGFNGRRTVILKKESFVKLHESYPGQTYTYGGWNRVEQPWAKGPALTHAGSNRLNYATIWIAPKIERAFLAATNIGDDHATRAVNETILSMIREFVH